MRLQLRLKSAEAFKFNARLKKLTHVIQIYIHLPLTKQLFFIISPSSGSLPSPVAALVSFTAGLAFFLDFFVCKYAI